MTDRRRTPPGGIRTPSEREIRETTPAGRPVHRDYRRPPTGPVQEGDFAREPVTGVLEGEDLDVARSRRPTLERVSHLEKKFDQRDQRDQERDDRTGRLEVAVAGISSELKANTVMTRQVSEQFPLLIQALTNDRKITQEEDHFVRRQTLEIGKAKTLDGIDAKKSWRDWIGKALGIAGALVALATAAFAAGRC